MFVLFPELTRKVGDAINTSPGCKTNDLNPNEGRPTFPTPGRHPLNKKQANKSRSILEFCSKEKAEMRNQNILGDFEFVCKYKTSYSRGHPTE